MDPGSDALQYLRLSLVPELGPLRLNRLLEAFGSPERVLTARPGELATIRGIGRTLAETIARGIADSERLAQEEMRLAERLGVRVVARSDPRYPPLLARIPDPPTVLYVRGDPACLARVPTLAIVGSRSCSAYGIEQAERFAGVLARTGAVIVSGGARGIDSAAHRGALRSGGPTVAVLGCGLAHCYPPENADLFDRIAASGALVSELPLNRAPEARNFPARNRIISGLCLGVLLIEAGKRSGALITARVAAEDHNREVMALPGRVDAPASQGTNNLIKQGGAALVIQPGDVLAILEAPARHALAGTHADRFAPSDPEAASQIEQAPPASLTIIQESILRALAEACTIDELATATGLDPHRLRAELTYLEIAGRVERQGSRLVRRRVQG